MSKAEDLKDIETLLDTAWDSLPKSTEKPTLEEIEQSKRYEASLVVLLNRYNYLEGDKQYEELKTEVWQFRVVLQIDVMFHNGTINDFLDSL